MRIFIARVCEIDAVTGIMVSSHFDIGYTWSIVILSQPGRPRLNRCNINILYFTLFRINCRLCSCVGSFVYTRSVVLFIIFHLLWCLIFSMNGMVVRGIGGWYISHLSKKILPKPSPPTGIYLYYMSTYDLRIIGTMPKRSYVTKDDLHSYTFA